MPEEPNEKYLEILGDYLVLCMEKQEKKEKKIITASRKKTLDTNETSFEGLVSQLENGEDGIYNLINESKTTILHPKPKKITKKDLEELEPLRLINEAIQFWESKKKNAQGKDASVIHQAIISLRQDQYVVRNAYKKPICHAKMMREKFPLEIPEKNIINEKGRVETEGISLCNPKVCSEILCNYSKLRQNAYGNFDGDLYYLMDAFEDTCERALQDLPIYKQIMVYKIAGKQNTEIQELIEIEFGVRHSLEYISSLWRKKIPGLIASQAEDDYLDWYYLNVEKGKYKKCSRCGQIKLAHNKYFSKNKTSKDTFYSICKSCRNTAKKEV